MILHLLAVDRTVALVLAPGRTYTVGRSASCDLAVEDETVSRRHAELEIAHGRLHLRDLGSTNGTFVQGGRVTEALAGPGDAVSFGKVAFTVAVVAVPTPDDDPLDATIHRQLPVSAANLAAHLSDAHPDATVLRIAGNPTERAGRKLDLLIDVAKELSGQADVEPLLARVADLAFQVMNVDRVAILTVDREHEGVLVPRVQRRRSGEEGGWRIPQRIARRVVDERVALQIENAPSDARFAGGSILFQGVQSALCAPLVGGEGKALGVIYLDNLRSAHSFSAEDLEFLRAFAGIVGVALENSRLVARTRREAIVLANFQRYFAADLAAQIASAEGEVRLGGSRRRVAILFSDIRGFTSLSEQLSPDEIAALLNDYFTEMVEVVFAHGGTLDKFIGDAVMALWGAPVGHDDDVERATAAAVAMQRALERLNAGWQAEGRRTLQIGIGLNVGEVFAGNIGSDRRLEYTVLGDAVNVAARLCGEAGPGEILVSETLYQSFATPPPALSLAPLPLKGKAQPVPVWLLQWEG